MLRLMVDGKNKTNLEPVGHGAFELLSLLSDGTSKNERVGKAERAFDGTGCLFEAMPLVDLFNGVGEGRGVHYIISRSPILPAGSPGLIHK